MAFQQNNELDFYFVQKNNFKERGISRHRYVIRRKIDMKISDYYFQGAQPLTCFKFDKRKMNINKSSILTLNFSQINNKQKYMQTKQIKQQKNLGDRFSRYLRKKMSQAGLTKSSHHFNIRSTYFCQKYKTKPL